MRPITATHVEVDGRPLVNFASNNYLGLTHHPAVVAAFEQAARTYGVGSGAASLVTGHTDAHATAERAIARWKGTEAAVLTSSGFAANLAAVGALAAVGRVRFLVDKLAHASLLDAARSTGAFRVYPHNGLAKLRRLLADADAGELQVVVTESIFSMDGDAADLPGLAALKAEFPFLLLVDEAHGSGVYGPAGGGVAAELGLTDAVDVTVATLSKAVGCGGGAVCSSAAVCDAVVNFGRPFVFSTSLPAAVAAAAEAAVGVMAAEPDRQRRVRSLALHVRDRLAAAGMTVPPGDSPIVPVMFGSAADALAAADRLRTAGLLVPAIRPPTVPPNGSRLRVTLSSEHTDDEIERLIAAVASTVRSLAG